MCCPQCSIEMIKARATNFGPEYDYCRICKKEYAELTPKKTEDSMVDVIAPTGLLAYLPTTPAQSIISYLLGSSSPCYAQPEFHMFGKVTPWYGELCNCTRYYWDTRLDRPISVAP